MVTVSGQSGSLTNGFTYSVVPTAPTNVSAMDGGPGPTVVAVQSLDEPTFVTSHTTAPFNSTGGNLIVLCASSHSGVTLTPSDTFGNTWIPIAGPTNANAGGFDLRTQLWYAPNAIVGPGHTITMGLSTPEPLVMSVFVVQHSNISSPIDAVSLIGSDTGTRSTSVASPSIITSLSNDLLIGFSKVSAGATFTAGAGFTLQPAASSNFLAAETGTAASAGSYGATFTLNSPQDWEAVITAVGYNPNQTTVSWTASTEVGGTIADYLVERCQGTGCTNFAQIGTTTGTTYNDVGLTGGPIYNYRVRAQDTANTDGPYSSVATVTIPTPIPSAPSAPANLTLSGATVDVAQSYINGTALTSHTTAGFNSTGGDLLVLCASSQAGVTFTPTDNFGNTYIPIAGPTSTTTGFDMRTQLWYVQSPTVGPGHTITMGLSSAQSLVMSIIVATGSNIPAPIDAVSLIGSDNGTQATTAVSPSVSTTGVNDLLIGFTKVSAGATFLGGPTFTIPVASSSNYLTAETGPAATPRGVTLRPSPSARERNMAGGGGGCGQQSRLK